MRRGVAVVGRSNDDSGAVWSEANTANNVRVSPRLTRPRLVLSESQTRQQVKQKGGANKKSRVENAGKIRWVAGRLGGKGQNAHRVFGGISFIRST